MKMFAIRKRSVSLFITFVSFLLLSACAFQPYNTRQQSCISQGWPHQKSDLTPDAALVFGTLKNGMRYVILPNHEPRNRVGLYLDVQSGSMVETDEQRGLAHYLEHMLFNGTTHYPPGTLVEYFQSIGMGFGADTNAHTSYDETVYKLLLPAGDSKTLQSGLVVMADYARGALLLEQEVDRERGIILAEKRARDSARSRVFKQRMKFTFAGTRIARRDPIGTESTLNMANSRLLRKYYDRWYRPENCLLVVVGDAEPGLVKNLIREQFADLTGADIPVVCPDFGKVKETGTAAFYQHEPDLGYTQVTLESVWNEKNQPDTLALEIRSLTEYVAGRILDNRLKHLIAQEDSPFTRASFYSGRVFKRYGNSSLSAQTSAENWQQGLTLLESTLRQALTFGFSQGELDRARKELLTQLNKQVQQADSRDSRKLANDLIYKLNNNEVMLSPSQELALYAPVLDKMTVEQVNRAFQHIWHERRLVEVAGTADLSQAGAQPESVILDVYKQSEKSALHPWVADQVVEFPYLSVPAPAARVKLRKSFSEIGVERVVFSNGLVLQLKQTDFSPNEINVSALFGQGRLSEPVPGIGRFAEAVVQESGVGKLSREQLAAALSGSSAKVSFKVSLDSFRFMGKGLSSEAELLFQLIATHLQDPAFRSAAYRHAMEKMAQMYGQLQSTAEGVMQLKGERFLAGGNTLYGFVPFSEAQKFRLDQVKQWLEPVFSHAGLEISVVGDFDPEAVIALAKTYFADPREKPLQAETGEPVTFPVGKTLQLDVASDSDRAMVTVGWPTEDFWDISRTRRMNILATVLDDRLRKQIREELGATYSPVVYNYPSRVNPGYGVLRAQMIVAPDQAGMLGEKLLEVGAGIVDNKVSKDELERALEPVLTSIRDTVRSNSYWMESVLAGSSRHPMQLEWPRTILDDFSSITVKDIQTLAEKYLRREKSATVIVIPGK